jgi:hypothetical protein
MLLVLSLIVGCNGDKDDMKGEFDIKGTITEIDGKGNRILVKETESKLIWITLQENGNINKFDKGQVVAVWIDGLIAESAPAQGKASNIEIITK